MTKTIKLLEQNYLQRFQIHIYTKYNRKGTNSKFFYNAFDCNLWGRV